MSFIDVKPIRAIKIHGTTYRSAPGAAYAYAESATHEFMHRLIKKGKIPKSMTIVQYNEVKAPIYEKFYRRGRMVFTR